MRGIKKHLPAILLTLVFITGLSLLLYPAVSNYWNIRRQTRIVSNYAGSVSELSGDACAQMLEAAREYNRTLAKRGEGYRFTDEDREEYEGLLNISGDGVMGTLDIPGISCRLPVYHGTGESELRAGAGHMEGSSLPVGGEGTHCVLSGHRGLPSARLFTDLNKVEEGDRFTLRVLNETLTYEVDQILTVEPYDLSALRIEEGKDYCTLVTCTPYGINSHRLLVRGRRVESRTEENVCAAADTVQKK